MDADQIEAAARELCRLRGEEVYEFPFDPQNCLERAKQEVATFAEVGTAIANTLAQKKPRKPRSSA